MGRPYLRAQLYRGLEMNIDIERLGLKNFQIDPETLITFPEGIAGFEQSTLQIN